MKATNIALHEVYKFIVQKKTWVSINIAFNACVK